MDTAWHFWSKEETEYLVGNWKTQTAKAIGVHLGLPVGAVSGKAKALNLSKPRPTFWTEERVEYLKKWWLAHDAKEIGNHLGCSKQAVIGKAFRLDLINKQEYWRDNGLKYSPGKRRPRAVVNGTNRAPKPPLYFGLGDTPPTCEPVGFMAITRDQCHAPLDIRGSDGLIMYCGDGVCKRLVKDGKDWSYTDAPYCAYHYRRFNKVGKNANK